MTRHLLLLALLVFGLAGCKSAGAPTSEGSAVLAAEGAGASPEQTTAIDRKVKAGDFVEVEVDPARVITQVTVKYNGQYTVPELNPDGTPRLNDEGQPRYRDGMYAYGYILDGAGGKREIAAKKFIDAFETDNWHDLDAVQGKTLRIEFRHSPTYASDPDVVAAATRIDMQSVTVRYADDPNAVYESFVYNADDWDELSDKAVRVQNGGVHKVKVDGARKLYRVDVRWGDAKPRVNGVYVPGTASGSLAVNGKVQGQKRNVAAIETQVWTLGDLPPPSGAGGEHEITVKFFGDDARIHWMRVYYQP